MTKQKINDKRFSWVNYPVVRLPMVIASLVVRDGHFISKERYPGKGATFLEQCNWIMKRLRVGEIGMLMGYRIIIDDREQERAIKWEGRIGGDPHNPSISPEEGGKMKIIKMKPKEIHVYPDNTVVEVYDDGFERVVFDERMKRKYLGLLKEEK